MYHNIAYISRTNISMGYFTSLLNSHPLKPSIFVGIFHNIEISGQIILAIQLSKSFVLENVPDFHSQFVSLCQRF